MDSMIVRTTLFEVGIPSIFFAFVYVLETGDGTFHVGQSRDSQTAGTVWLSEMDQNLGSTV